MEHGNSSNSCWTRIETIMFYYDIPSVCALARRINLKRSENLFQIKRGRNRISFALVEQICEHLPDISKAWLLTGEGAMIVARDSDMPFFLETAFPPAEVELK